jgi:hypothetical protein
MRVNVPARRNTPIAHALLRRSLQLHQRIQWLNAARIGGGQSRGTIARAATGVQPSTPKPSAHETRLGLGVSVTVVDDCKR